MSMQFEQQRVASVVKRNLQKFKILTGDKEKKFNDLINPFTKLDTFINAKSILKSIVKPSGRHLDPIQQQVIPKQQQRSSLLQADFNTENFYEDVDELINQLEKEQNETKNMSNKKISQSEILDFRNRHPNFKQVSKLFAQQSTKMIAILNRKSTNIYNKKYSVLRTSPRQSLSNHTIAITTEREPAQSKYSNFKTQKLVELKGIKQQSFKMKTEPKQGRNYSQQIQQLISSIEDTHKQMTGETDLLQKKTTRFILNQSKNSVKPSQFDYLASDNNFIFSKIKKRVL